MNWYCIHSKPLKEPQTARYCREMLGVETYFPRLKRTKTIRRVRREVTSPLFPRYFFCRFEVATHFRAVRYAPDVIGIVSRGERPCVVEDSLIEELKDWAGETLDAEIIHPPIRVGDSVQITDGPLSGLEAVVLHEMSDSDRVAVLLSILQCGARVIINRSQLARAV